MSDGKELSFAEVAKHSNKKDLYLVIHNKVYNTTDFIDEHPGGEEVLLDVGGQDATEAFEDVGHSDEAREILDGLKIGELKSGELQTKTTSSTTTTSNGTAGAKAKVTSDSGTGLGTGLYAALLIGGVAAFGAYKYFEQQQQQE